MFVTRIVRRSSLLALVLVALSLTMLGAAPAAPFPEIIALPDGFQPEGIASLDQFKRGYADQIPK